MHAAPRIRRAATALVGLALITSCSAPTTGSGSTAAGDNQSALVLADPQRPGNFNVLDGHAVYGVSPIFEGLLRFESEGDDKTPKIVPALAESAPTTSEDGLTWTVTLRKGVKYSDGSAFDADDVVATYRNMIDPKVASTVASDFAMIAAVDRTDEHTVTFTLKYPYAEFDTRLLLGIAPTEKLTGVPADKSPLNSSPIGTGPYTLVEATAEKAVLKSNPNYWRGEPKVRSLTIMHIPDDNSRAQRIAAGEIDGSVLPPTLAATLKKNDKLTYTSVRSVDFRTIALPKTSVFAKDPAARMAMNLAVDRKAMVDKILAGEGTPISVPIPPELGDAHVKEAAFPHDVAAAESALDKAGWVKGADGIRAKGEEKASFTVLYAASDTVRTQLATAFAADMKKIGINIVLEGSTWDKIEPQLGKAGLVLGGGKYPNSLDSLVHTVLHRRDANTSSPYSNPGDYGSEQLDALLDGARRETDADQRQEMYHQVQTEYMKDPGSIFLVNLRHTYVAKKDTPRTKATLLEPHAHSAGWGPWWDLGHVR